MMELALGAASRRASDEAGEFSGIDGVGGLSACRFQPMRTDEYAWGELLPAAGSALSESGAAYMKGTSTRV